MKVAYSFDNESYSCCYDTEEEALADALREIESILKYNPECAPGLVYVGDCELFKPSLSGSSWDIIEAAVCQADDEGFGEWADDYLSDVKKEHREELEENLEKVFQEWIEKYNYHANFYKVNSYSVYRYDEEKHEFHKTDEGSSRE